MADFILPSKLVSEKIEVIFDFTDELEWGETLVSWSCDVTTLTGDDDTPKLLLATRIIQSGKTVRQQFYRGVPGCIYALICDVTTNLGARLRKTGKLAILPDGALNPPLYATYLTTPPYPIEGIDSLQVTLPTIQRAVLNYTVFSDGIQATGMVPLEGNLWGSLGTYTPDPESFQMLAPQPLEGNLWGGLKTYTAGPESFQTYNAQILEGNLWGSLLVYTAPPEDFFAVSLSVLSGTLT